MGKKTASGEIPQQSHRHQRRSLAAAVGLREGENLDNSRSGIVKINDRGPYTRGRMIDLSPRSADALDMKHVGVASIVIGPLVRRVRLAPRFKLPVRWCRNKPPARREARTSDNSAGGWFENQRIEVSPCHATVPRSAWDHQRGEPSPLVRAGSVIFIFASPHDLGESLCGAVAPSEVQFKMRGQEGRYLSGRVHPRLELLGRPARAGYADFRNEVLGCMNVTVLRPESYR